MSNTQSSPQQSSPRHLPVVIVGGGQAGLAVSWYLCRAGTEHLVVESDTLLHQWPDARWDNFTLVTPNWHLQMPGYSYDGPEPEGFMTRDEVIEWFNGWLGTFNPPVREHTRVTSLDPLPGGGFTVTLEGPDGTEIVTTDEAVIATGGYQISQTPDYAKALDPSVRQLFADTYTNPDDLPEGAVLVVGSGQSGTQIAEDLFLAGRDVHLAVGNAPRVARRYRGKDCMTWLGDMGLYDLPIEQYPGGLANREKTTHYVTGRDGGRDIDLRAFARDGMHLYGALAGGQGTTLQFEPTLTKALDSADATYNSILRDIDAHISAHGLDQPAGTHYTPVWTPPEDEITDLDLAEAGITSIIWTIGFKPDYSWIHVPAFDGKGLPVHDRGLTEVAGLSFIGLAWMHTWGSGRVLGLDRDAAFLAATIAERLGASAAV